MSVEELMKSLKKAGGTFGAISTGCKEGEVLCTLVQGRDGEESIAVRCGCDCVFARIDDVAYLGRTSGGLKVHLKGPDGSIAYLTLSAGKKAVKQRSVGVIG